MNVFHALFLGASLALVACGGAASIPATPAVPGASSGAQAAASAVKQPGEATVGDKTLCPVSKEEFTVTATSPKAEYKGKTYYFCCGGCDAKFKENPEKFLGGGKS